MRLLYEEGPETVSMGIAGQFKRGEAKEVADEIAEVLLKKQTIKFKNVNEIPNPEKSGRNDKKKKEE